MDEVILDRTGELNLPEAVYFPLSPAQLGIWFAQAVDPDVPINNVNYVDLRGPVDPDKVADAGIRIAEELGSIALRLKVVDGIPMQAVDPDSTMTLTTVDLRDEADPHAAAVEWMRRDYARPVNPRAPNWLFFTAMLRLEDERYYWYNRIHHITVDGFGAINVLTGSPNATVRSSRRREPAIFKASSLEQLYEAEISYRDSSRFQTDRAYWAAKVAGVEQGTTLNGRSAPPAAIPVVATAALDTEHVDRLEREAQRLEDDHRRTADSVVRRLSRAHDRYLRDHPQPSSDRSNDRGHAPFSGHGVQHRAATFPHRCFHDGRGPPAGGTRSDGSPPSPALSARRYSP